MKPDSVRPKSERAVLLSTLPTGARQRRLALAVVSVSLVFFAIAASLARRPLTLVAAFILIYESALIRVSRARPRSRLRKHVTNFGRRSTAGRSV